MKAEFLKIAGVKSEKAFYKKYPTEAAFFKAHPEAKKKVNKAQNFGNLNDTNNNGIPDFLENINAMNDPRFGQTANYANTMGYGYTPQVMPITSNLKSSGLAKLPNQLPVGKSFTPKELMGNSAQKKGSNAMDMVGKGLGFINDVRQLDQDSKAAENLTKKLETWADVSDVILRADRSNQELRKQQKLEQNKWVRPDDKRFIANTDQLYNTQGRGSDILTGQNGSFIGGNPTEIQNTYAPNNTLYDDLGYEPLQNEDQVKAYQTGGGFGEWFGKMNSALGGSETGGFMGNFGVSSPFAGMIAGSNNSAEGRKWGKIGSIFGPGVGLLAEQIGTAFDKNPGRQRNAMNRMDFNNRLMGQEDSAYNITSNLQGMNVAKDGAELFSYEEGGYMNPEYNPQLIAMFGDHTAEDFADYAHKFRAGGHLKEYTPPSERAMETYAMGGQLQTHWGGEVNPIAYNPYLPGSGEVGMLSGASHKNGGIGISYTSGEDDYQGMAANGTEMGAQVEAETGEPIIEMAEGGSINPQTGQPNTSAVIFGNIPFSKKLAQATGDQALIDLAKEKDGKTYKKIIADFAKPQKKAQETKVKASKIANDADNTKWGALDLKTAEMMEYGGDQTQKDYADLIMKLANLQDATQEVKKEQSYIRGKNISAEALGKSGKLETDYDPITKDAEIENPYAKSGAFLRKAQNSATIGDDKEYVSKYGLVPWKGNVGKGNKYGKATASSFTTKQWDDIADKLGFKGKGNKEFQEFLLNNPESAPLIKARHQNLYGKDTPMIDEKLGYGWTANELLLPKAAEVPTNTTTTNQTTTNQTTEAPKDTDVIPYKRNKLADFANMIAPFFQNDNLPPIDPRQFTKEYLAIAQNVPYGVQAQQYAPELDPIYRISYEDIMNQNTADFRDVERQLGNNPAALAALLANKYKANQAVKGEEFRANQAIEQQIFGGNRGKINQARAINLQLLADQRDKQLEGEAITNRTKQEAFGSIANKYLEHEARDAEYRIKRNLFPNYRYGESGNIYTQGYTQLNIPQMYGNKASFIQVPKYGPNGEITGYELKPYDPSANGGVGTPPLRPVSKNGKSIVKNAKNSSIVKAFKNL